MDKELLNDMVEDVEEKLEWLKENVAKIVEERLSNVESYVNDLLDDIDSVSKSVRYIKEEINKDEQI